MSLQVIEQLKQGFRRTFAPNGLMMIALFSPLLLINVVILNGFLASSGRLPGDPAVSHPFIQQIGAMVPTATFLLLYVVILLLSTVLLIAALRTFTGDETDTLPAEYFTRNMGWALINFVIAYILVLLAFLFGLVLLVIPGIFLLASFWFYSVYVAVEDKNFIEAIAGSWELTSGNRFPVFFIGLGVLLVMWAFTIVAAPVLVLLGGGLGAELFNAIPSAIGIVYMYATTAQTYNALKDLEEPAEPEDSEEDSDEGEDTETPDVDDEQVDDE